MTENRVPYNTNGKKGTGPKSAYWLCTITYNDKNGEHHCEYRTVTMAKQDAIVALDLAISGWRFDRENEQETEPVTFIEAVLTQRASKDE